MQMKKQRVPDSHSEVVRKPLLRVVLSCAKSGLFRQLAGYPLKQQFPVWFAVVVNPIVERKGLIRWKVATVVLTSPRDCDVVSS